MIIKIVKHILITILLLFPIFCFAQETSIEESALGFYLNNIYSNGDRLYSTGKIETEVNAFNSRYFMFEFLNCKKNNSKDTIEANLYRKSYLGLAEKYKSSTLVILNVDSLELRNLVVKLPKPIRKVKNLNHQKLKGGLIGLLRKASNKIFGEPFNIYLYRHLEFAGSFYTLIAVTKKDAEYSRDYWFKLSKEGKVIDWCEGGWMQ